jgi:hypothetical protein
VDEMTAGPRFNSQAPPELVESQHDRKMPSQVQFSGSAAVQRPPHSQRGNRGRLPVFRSDCNRSRTPSECGTHVVRNLFRLFALQGLSRAHHRARSGPSSAIILPYRTTVLFHVAHFWQSVILRGQGRTQRTVQNTELYWFPRSLERTVAGALD